MAWLCGTTPAFVRTPETQPVVCTLAELHRAFSVDAGLRGRLQIWDGEAWTVVRGSRLLVGDEVSPQPAHGIAQHTVVRLVDRVRTGRARARAQAAVLCAPHRDVPGLIQLQNADTCVIGRPDALVLRANTVPASAIAAEVLGALDELPRELGGLIASYATDTLPLSEAGALHLATEDLVGEHVDFPPRGTPIGEEGPADLNDSFGRDGPCARCAAAWHPVAAFVDAEDSRGTHFCLIGDAPATRASLLRAFTRHQCSDFLAKHMPSALGSYRTALLHMALGAHLGIRRITVLPVNSCGVWLMLAATRELGAMCDAIYTYNDSFLSSQRERAETAAFEAVPFEESDTAGILACERRPQDRRPLEAHGHTTVNPAHDGLVAVATASGSFHAGVGLLRFVAIDVGGDETAGTGAV